MSDKKRLISNFFSLFILQGANYILPLLTLPYLVRVLGVEKFGLISFATATMSYLLVLSDFGFNLSATREISIHRDDPQKIGEVFSAVMLIKLMLVAVGLLALVILVFSVEKFRQDALVYLFSFGTVIGQAIFPIWFFQGMERMKYITYVNILAKVLFTAAIFVFVHKKEDYLLVPVLTSLGYIVAGSWSLLLVKRNFGIRMRRVSANVLRYYFKDSSQYFISRVSVSIYTSSNAFVLGLLTNNTTVGIYVMAEKLYMAFQSAYQPLMTVIYPYVAKQKRIDVFKKIFTVVTAVNTLGIGILLLVTAQLLALIFGKSVDPATNDVLRVLLLAAVIVVPSILMGYPFLGALGHAKHANLSVIYGAVLHFFLLGMLIAVGHIEAVYVAFAVLITESFVFIYRVYWTRRLGLWQRQS